MATGGVKGDSDYIDQVLSCQICLNPLVNRKARILSCLHTFCEACLENVLSRQPGKQITCSICRQPTELQHGLVSDIPLNFNIDQAHRMAEVMAKTVFCSKCCKRAEYVPSTQRCITCRRHMCDTCKNQHDKFPGFSDHQVEQLEHEQPGRSERLCNAHNSPVCLFCKKCKVLLCSQCLTEETHDSHPDDIMTVDHALSDMQTLLLDKKGVVVKQLEFVREKIEVKSRQLEHLAGVEKDIIKKIDFLKSCIDKSGNYLLKELKENYIAKIQREKAHLTDFLNRGKSSLKALEGFELDKTIRILDNSDSWIQDISEFEELLSGLNNEVETAMVKFAKQLQVSVIGKLEKIDLPPLVRVPDRLDLLTPGDLLKLSKQISNPAAAKPTLVKKYKTSSLSVNKYGDVATLGDGSAASIAESDDEILRINHQGDIVSRYKPDGGDKIKSISAFNKTIICTFYGKSEFLELALVGNNITLTKIHSKHGIKPDGVCVDCSGNIILYDKKTVTKLDSRDNIVWQKTAETCNRVRSGILDNKLCYLVNYDPTRKTEIWNEAGEVIGTLKYCRPHQHHQVVRDMTVSHKGTFIVTHRCTNIIPEDCYTVTEYAPDGSFIRHLLTQENGVYCPCRASCDQEGYMWITDTSFINQTICIYQLYL